MVSLQQLLAGAIQMNTKTLRYIIVVISFLLPVSLFGQSVSIGDILCTDGSTVRPEQFASSGKTAEGIVFYVDEIENQGWAVSLECQAVNTHWVTEEHYYDMYDIPELENFEYSREAIYDLDGYSNTGFIRLAHGADWYPAAWSVDFDHGWYLPAAGQLRWMMAYINEINASLAVVHGTTFTFNHPRWYWASTERTYAHAVVVSQTGSVGNYPKWNYIGEYEIGVRAVKTFSVLSPSHHIGEVVTTPDGQKGVVYYISPDDGSYWLVALNDLSSSYPWGPETDITSLNNYNESNQYVKLHGVHCGYDATSYMREAIGTSSQYASSHVDLDHGWHIPSAGQLSKLFATLPFIESVLTDNGGSTLSDNCYWTSTECSPEKAWTVNYGTDPHTAGILTAREKSYSYPVRPVWSEPCNIAPPTMGSIDPPEPFCANESMNLQEPDTQYATSQGWQLSPTPDFGSLIEYYGEPIGFDHNGWYLRYFATNQFGTVYSNSVCISVWPTYATSFNITSCTPYVWNGITYSEPGSYEQTLPSIYGCDSVVTLNLTFDSINKREVFLTGCDEIVYNGVAYNQSGNYQQIIPALTGCDTIIELYLNIGHSPYVSQIHGENLIYYQDDGIYTYSIDTVPGCFGYEWSLDGLWELDSSPDSPVCSIDINSFGSANLKVRVYTECGYTERSLYIKHDARPDVVIYPNPTLGEFNIVLYGMKGEAVIVVYDYLGKFIDRFSVDTDVEGTVIPYSLTGKAAGVYLISVMNYFDMVTRKVIKNTPSTFGFPSWIW